MEGASDGSGKKTAGFEETRLKKWQGGHFLRTFQGSALTALHCCRLRPFDKLRDRFRQQLTPFQSGVGFIVGHFMQMQLGLKAPRRPYNPA